MAIPRFTPEDSTLSTEEFVQPQPKRRGVAFLVKDIGTELLLESSPKDIRVDSSFSNEECHIGSITCAVSAQLREDEIVDLEGTKPKPLEPSRRETGEP